MKKRHFIVALVLLLLVAGCANKSRRTEIEQRKAALVHKQDSALAEARQRLAETDSMLEAARADHDRQHKWVMEHSRQLNDDSPEVLKLNRLRQYRDSLQTEWETLGAKIKYIRKLQNKE